MTETVVAIIQARMSSSRLPGKVLRHIAGRPMLGWVVARSRRARRITGVLVATTTAPDDDAVAAYCRQQGYDCLRGSLNDVLDRYYQAARQVQADVVVRITADCPFIDPVLIDEAADALLDGGFDFVANRLPSPWRRTYPIGLDVEVFTFAALQRAWQEADQRHQREHVTPYFYEDAPVEPLQPTHKERAHTRTPRGFRIALLHAPADYGHLRWTVDTSEDLTLAREIAAHFPDDTFSWMDILRLVEEHPHLTRINAAVRHKTHLDTDERL